MDTKNSDLIQKIVEGKERKIVIRQNMIISQQHTLKTVTMEKIALSGFDIKRLVLNDNIHTLPHGHYEHRKSPQEDQQNERIQDIDWDEDITILQNETDTRNADNEKNTITMGYEDIDWNDISILHTANMENNEKEKEDNERENTINSLCMDIEWDEISIIDEKNICSPQTSGKEEQIMVDTFLTNIHWEDTQITRNIEENIAGREEERNNTEEETVNIYSWFEENNVNSYDMEPAEEEWEIPAFSMPQ